MKKNVCWFGIIFSIFVITAGTLVAQGSEVADIGITLVDPSLVLDDSAPPAPCDDTKDTTRTRDTKKKNSSVVTGQITEGCFCGKWLETKRVTYGKDCDGNQIDMEEDKAEINEIFYKNNGQVICVAAVLSTSESKDELCDQRSSSSSSSASSQASSAGTNNQSSSNTSSSSSSSCPDCAVLDKYDEKRSFCVFLGKDNKGEVHFFSLQKKEEVTNYLKSREEGCCEIAKEFNSSSCTTGVSVRNGKPWKNIGKCDGNEPSCQSLRDEFFAHQDNDGRGLVGVGEVLLGDPRLKDIPGGAGS